MRRFNLKAFTGLKQVIGMLLAVWLLLEPMGHLVRAGVNPGTGATPSIEDEAVFRELSAGKRIKAERSYTVPEQPTVYLTFDDGPSAYTSQVLDILQREQIKATFFVLGQEVPKRKELLQRMVKEGHAVGNHSYNHVYKELYSDFSVFWEQVKKTDAILEEATGYQPVLLRAPGGTYTNFDAFYYYYLEEAGYQIVDWNVDSGDALRQGVKAEEILATIRKSVLKHELVVLMHDGTGHGETVKALPEIISYYRDKGYSFAPLGGEAAPVQFSLGKSKWSRSYSLDGFAQRSAEALAAGLARSGPGVEQGEGLQVAAGGISGAQGNTGPGASGGTASLVRDDVPKADTVPLTVTVGDTQAWPLAPGQYSFDNSRFAVPLRGLAERLGGVVVWNEQQQVATVQTGTGLLQFDPKRRVISEYRPGQPDITHYLADITWKDGELRIPLRAGAALLGGTVLSYELGGTERRVALASPGERPVALLCHPLQSLWLGQSRKLHV